MNPKKLLDVKFSFKPAGITEAKYIKEYRLPEATSLPGLRTMEPADVPAVYNLLNKHLVDMYSVHINFSE